MIPLPPSYIKYFSIFSLFCTCYGGYNLFSCYLHWLRNISSFFGAMDKSNRERSSARTRNAAPKKTKKKNQTANDETMRTYKNMAAKTRRANQTHMKPHSIAVGGATDSMETLWLMGSYDRHGIIQLYRHAKDATATFLSHHAVLPGGVEAHRRRLSGKVNTGSNAELPGSSEPQDDVTHNLQ